MTITDFPRYTQSKNSVDSDVSSSGTISTSNLVQMTISAEGTAHIMSLLTDLYSSPELAVLREYASNAKDSHTEAGQTLPIKVTLPTSWNPVFTVQDFGVGMSSQDIKTIYASYGASTKQKDFTQVGAFGLGCKSALSLTQQFTLISIKDGRKSTVLISRGDNGVGSVNVISEIDTNEPNGVTVSVPIEKVGTFNSHVSNFFFTWEPGSVLIDDAEPLSLYSDNFLESADKKVFFNISDSNESQRHGFNIIMGGITYSVDMRPLIKNLYSDEAYVHRSMCDYLKRSAVAYVIVPIGSVDLTPSREEVRYSERSTEFLTSLFDFFIEQVSIMLTDSLSHLTSRAEVLDMCSEYHYLLLMYRNSTHTASKIIWNGEEIPRVLSLDDPILRFSVSYNNRSSRKFSKAQRILDANIHIGASRSYYIVESDPEKVNRIGRDLHLYLERSNHQAVFNPFYVFSEEPTSLWITDNERFTRISSDTIMDSAKELRKEVRAASRSKGKTTFDYWVLFFNKDATSGEITLQWEHVDSEDISEDVYFIGKSESAYVDSFIKNPRSGVWKNKEFGRVLDDYGTKDGDSFVTLRQGQTIEALERRVGSSLTSLSSLKESSLQSFISNMPEESACFSSIISENGYYATILNNISALFDGNWVPDSTDNILPSLHQSLKDSLQYKDKYARMFSMHYTKLPKTTEDAVSSLKRRLEAVVGSYPLLSLDVSQYSRRSQHLKHYHDYINMVDAKERNTNVIPV